MGDGRVLLSIDAFYFVGLEAIEGRRGFFFFFFFPWGCCAGGVQ